MTHSRCVPYKTCLLCGGEVWRLAGSPSACIDGTPADHPCDSAFLQWRVLVHESLHTCVQACDQLCEVAFQRWSGEVREPMPLSTCVWPCKPLDGCKREPIVATFDLTRPTVMSTQEDAVDDITAIVIFIKSDFA